MSKTLAANALIANALNSLSDASASCRSRRGSLYFRMRRGDWAAIPALQDLMAAGVKCAVRTGGTIHTVTEGGVWSTRIAKLNRAHMIIVVQAQ